MAESALGLNQSNLQLISAKIKVPSYDRSKIQPGIVHIGIGNFTRAHQILYMNRLFQKGLDQDFGIVGIGILPQDQKMKQILKEQDCLYTLIQSSASSEDTEVVGSLIDFIHAAESESEQQRALQLMANPQIKIVTLTVTEKGYFYNLEGNLDFNAPQIQHDLATYKTNPKTSIGYLVSALNARKIQNIHPFTVLCCDNLQENGSLLQNLVLQFSQRVDQELHQWIKEKVCFPNCMVDRITPQTTQKEIDYLNSQFQLIDKWPVKCENFIQWVVEDNFNTPRPEWEQVGVQIVKDVKPYEILKLRILNGSHQAMAYFSELLNLDKVDIAMRDPQILQVVQKYMDEIETTLDPIPGVNVNDYKQCIIERFSNPKISDQTARIYMDGYNKVQQFLIHGLKQLKQLGYANALVIASYLRFIQGEGENKLKIKLNDPFEEKLTTLGNELKQNQTDEKVKDVLNQLFGQEITRNQEFVAKVGEVLRDLYEVGARETLKKHLQWDYETA